MKCARRIRRDLHDVVFALWRAGAELAFAGLAADVRDRALPGETAGAFIARRPPEDAGGSGP